jgi:hypothetical protein
MKKVRSPAWEVANLSFEPGMQPVSEILHDSLTLRPLVPKGQHV